MKTMYTDAEEQGEASTEDKHYHFALNQKKNFVLAIEEYTGDEIDRFDLDKGDYLEILGGSDDGSNNWQKLIDQENKFKDLDKEW